MTCQMCGGKTTVVDCGSDFDIVIRRRKCLECGFIFFTQEIDFPDDNAGKLLKKLKVSKND